MKSQEVPPGLDGNTLSREPTGFVPAIEYPVPLDINLGQWANEYLRIPSKHRIGVCCSGGGIRSASYCLGALQVLEPAKVLEKAEYLGAVSGGNYTASAYTAVAAATFGDFLKGEPPSSPTFPPDPAEPDSDSFKTLRPFAPNSPEERNLRDDSAYLARGLNGKIWLGINVLYGAIRHLVPFVAGLFILGAAAGFGLHRWVGHSLQLTSDGDLAPMVWTFVYWNLWTAAGILVVGAGVLGLRKRVASARHPSATLMAALQGVAMLMLRAAIGVAALLAGLPALLRMILIVRNAALWGWLPAGAATAVTAAYAYLTKRGQARRLLKGLRLLLPFAGALALGVPFVGFTYWVTQQGFHLHNGPLPYQQAGPLWALFISVFILAWYSASDEVTPTHLFYREKLAKAFIGMRVRSGNILDRREPPSRIPLSLSKVADHAAHGVKLPKLVVCASVNASDESVPLGRNAGPSPSNRITPEARLRATCALATWKLPPANRSSRCPR